VEPPADFAPDRCDRLTNGHAATRGCRNGDARCRNGDARLP